MKTFFYPTMLLKKRKKFNDYNKVVYSKYFISKKDNIA